MRFATIEKSSILDYSGNEALNTICTNLSFSGRNIRKVVMTSCVPGEGKSFMAMQVMLNMAYRGKRCILVDVDLRRSYTLRRYGIRVEGEALGVAHYLAGYCSLDDAVYETNIPGAYIMPVGRDVANPMPLIDSPFFAEMLEILAGEFDLVLVDTPPIGAVVDSAVIAKNCDGTVMVVEYGQRRRSELKSAVEQMEQSGTPVLGCILNKVTFNTLTEKKYYKNSYYSHYGDKYGYYKKDNKDSTNADGAKK